MLQFAALTLPVTELTYHSEMVQYRVGYSRGAREPGSHEIFAAIHTVLAYFLSNEGILSIKHNMLELCHRKKKLGTTSNYLSQEEIYFHKKKFLFEARNFS